MVSGGKAQPDRPLRLSDLHGVSALRHRDLAFCRHFARHVADLRHHRAPVIGQRAGNLGGADGLARSALVYDVWGDTVTEAEHLARTTESGTIVVSDAVRTQLPSSFVTVGDTGGAVAVTAHVSETEVSS